MMLKNIILVLLSLCFLACSFDKAKTPTPKKQQPKVLVEEKLSFDEPWEGYYHGVLTCKNCKGVDTWFLIQKQGEDTLYEMREKFLGQKNRYSQGEFFWKQYAKSGAKNQSEKSYMHFGANYIKLSGNQRLSKLTPFITKGSTLLIEPKSLLKGKTNGGVVVRFSGLRNFSKPTNDRYKSTKARYFINCKKKTYDISLASYYERRYAMGNTVRMSIQKPKVLHVKDDILLQKAYERYCW